VQVQAWGIRGYEHNLQSVWSGNLTGTAVLQFLRHATNSTSRPAEAILRHVRQFDGAWRRVLQ